ncbi:MAG TPA: 1-(5-phosphoribosyl)-5-[(5-phosphoribosylamino)methylideneamino] imidazole-4-carboxamide isomerase [Gemmatimonadaceae bacterium]
MIVIPAVDLRDGACVQLVGGAYDQEQLRLDDPIEVARSWVRLGFQRLHVVDLDATTGHGQNAALVRGILQAVDVDIQVGGGIRTTDEIERLLHDGADRVVLGTRAIEEPEWLADVAVQFPERIVVAADVRDRRVVTRGWARTTPRNVLAVIEDLNELPLAALLVTAVHREGRLAGTDLFLMEDATEISTHPVIASGGITAVRELRELEERGVSAAVVGMALYMGLLDASSVVEEFSA